MPHSKPRSRLDLVLAWLSRDMYARRSSAVLLLLVTTSICTMRSGRRCRHTLDSRFSWHGLPMNPSKHALHGHLAQRRRHRSRTGVKFPPTLPSILAREHLPAANAVQDQCSAEGRIGPRVKTRPLGKGAEMWCTLIDNLKGPCDARLNWKGSTSFTNDVALEAPAAGLFFAGTSFPCAFWMCALPGMFHDSNRAPSY